MKFVPDLLLLPSDGSLISSSFKAYHLSVCLQAGYYHLDLPKKSEDGS